MQMVRKDIHRTENNDLLLQPRLREQRLQRTYPGTQTATQKERGADADTPVFRGAGLLLIRPSRKTDGRQPAIHI